MFKKIVSLVVLSFVISCVGYASPSTSEITPEKICNAKECYTVLKTLGEGAFGVVYEVKDSAGNLYAIKSYRKFEKDSPLANIPFADPLREYSRGQLFDHPNIIKSYNLFTNNTLGQDTTYLVLQFVDGKIMQSIDKGRFSREEAYYLSLQFIEALRYALSLGFLHLDLHGGNIMVDQSNNIKIIDLASFFSVDEMTTFAKQQSPNQSEQEKGYPIKDNKMHKFFGKNPQLLTKMQEKKPSKQQDFDQVQFGYMLSYYFNTLTDFCASILSKSDMTREEKFELRAQIKKVAWAYTEDIEDGLNVSIDDYFDQLTTTLQ